MPRLPIKDNFTDPDMIPASWLNAIATYLDGAAGYCAGAPSITAGAEAANAITVTIQANDTRGVALAEHRLLRAWLSDTQWGGDATAEPDGGVAVTAGVTLQTITAGLHWELLTDASGQVALTITESTAKTYWLHATAGDRVAAAQVTFAG
jgi:hypothetical protein